MSFQTQDLLSYVEQKNVDFEKLSKLYLFYTITAHSDHRC